MGEWDWRPYPEAEEFIEGQINHFLGKSSYALDLSGRIERGTSTRFGDWIDHLLVPEAAVDLERIHEIGFREMPDAPMENAIPYRVEGSDLPPIALGEKETHELALKVELIEDFKRIHVPARKIEGEFASPFSRLVVKEEDGFILTAVERRGYDGFMVQQGIDVPDYIKALNAFQSRPRLFEYDSKGMEYLALLIKDMLIELDTSRVADAFFRAERRYWETRNRAAQVQRAKQDGLGLGWANHDHHTFRSSRGRFRTLMRILQSLGMEPRERLHSESQPEWGSHLFEQRDCGVVVFADVDLDQDEMEMDIIQQGLDRSDELGTVGLWTGLHGESILQAGMHHLAVELNVDRAVADLNEQGVNMMEPSLNSPPLKRAFTEQEVWHPKRGRLEELLSQGYISIHQMKDFEEKGATGSCMEGIQREQGFKGFDRLL
jgi:hypothetical protein